MSHQVVKLMTPGTFNDTFYEATLFTEKICHQKLENKSKCGGEKKLFYEPTLFTEKICHQKLENKSKYREKKERYYWYNVNINCKCKDA